MLLLSDPGSSSLPVLTSLPGFHATYHPFDSMQPPAADGGPNTATDQFVQQQQHGRPTGEATGGNLPLRLMVPPAPDTSSIIAHSPTASYTPSTAASSASSPTNVQSRKAVCTHMRLMRIYGPYKCHHCGRIPRLGWVYRCVQDFGDDFVGFRHRHDDNFTSALRRRLEQESTAQSQRVETPSAAQKRPRTSPSGPSVQGEPVSDRPSRALGGAVLNPGLKPWMQKLADDAFYTEDQVRTITAQRWQVLQRISESNFLREPTKSDLQGLIISDPTVLVMSKAPRIALPSPLGGIQRSSTIAPYWQTPGPSRSPSVPKYSALKQTGRSDESSGQHRVASSAQQALPAGSICTYQTCSTCRPASRDRSWQCLDASHVHASVDQMQLPDPATDNRLISHPHLVKLACYKFFNPDPQLDASGIQTSEDDFYDDDYGSGYDSSDISPDISSGVSREGTPTVAQFDESHSWDAPVTSIFRPGLRPQPSDVHSGRPRVIRRASSMDPRLLRSSRDMENMDLGAIADRLGINVAGNAGAGASAGASTSGRYTGEEAADGTDKLVVVDDWRVRPGAEAALGFRVDEVDGGTDAISKQPGAEVVVADGVAVMEEAVASGDPDIITQA